MFKKPSLLREGFSSYGLVRFVLHNPETVACVAEKGMPLFDEAEPAGQCKMDGSGIVSFYDGKKHGIADGFLLPV